MTRHVAFYARVSTPEQHVEPQLHALRQYATARELEVGASASELARRFGIARGTVRKLVVGEVGRKALYGRTRGSDRASWGDRASLPTSLAGRFGRLSPGKNRAVSAKAKGRTGPK